MNSPLLKIQPKDKRVKNFDEVSLGIGKRTAIEEARRYPQYSNPDLHPASPVGVDIPGFIRFLREGNVNAALRKIKEHNILPGVCSRVCPAFKCPEALTKEKGGVIDIDIRALQRFTADYGRVQLDVPALNGSAKKVAVIGSGPAGLAAAAQLARLGYDVTVFEALPFLGGKLRYGIPSFRLPRNILENEIEDIRRLGVKFKIGIVVGCSKTILEVIEEGFEAVVLTVGLGRPKLSDVEGGDLIGVYSAEDFLLQCNVYKKAQILSKLSFKIGGRVVIYGSNEQALDSARILIRLGLSVKIIMPGTEEDWFDLREVDFAKEEGVEIFPLSEITGILGDAGSRVTRVRCRQLDFADPESNGQWRVMPVPDSDFELEADTVIMSLGQEPNPYLKQWVPQLQTQEDGRVYVSPENGMTSVDKVFAAGEAVTGTKFVDEIMADGIKVAGCVHAFLQEMKHESPQNS